MTFPFEVDFDEVRSNLDACVDVVFECLESEFLVMPKGAGFVEFPAFEAGYEALKRATGRDPRQGLHPAKHGTARGEHPARGVPLTVDSPGGPLRPDAALVLLPPAMLGFSRWFPLRPCRRTRSVSPLRASAGTERCGGAPPPILRRTGPVGGPAPSPGGRGAGGGGVRGAVLRRPRGRARAAVRAPSPARGASSRGRDGAWTAPG